MLGQNQSYDHRSNRELLDKLFAADAVISMMFGIITLITPHVFIAELAGGSYNHSVHEALRYIYTCHLSKQPASKSNYSSFEIAECTLVCD